MDKVIIYLIFNLMFIFLSCTQPSGNSIPITHNIIKDSIPKDTLNPSKNYISGMGNRLENFVSVNPSLLSKGTVIPFTGKIRELDIPKYGFILDTLVFKNDSSQIFFNRIYGLTQTNFFIYNYITPEYDKDELISYKFLGDTVIIPFRFDIDQEGTLLTRWKKTSTDTLEYLDYFKTPFGTKYSRLEILEVTNQPDQQFIIGKTHFGEGGESGEELWLARILRDNRLKISYLTSCGWNYDSDTIPTFQYEKINGGIKIHMTTYQRDNKTGLASKQLLSKQNRGSFMFVDY